MGVMMKGNKKQQEKERVAQELYDYEDPMVTNERFVERDIYEGMGPWIKKEIWVGAKFFRAMEEKFLSKEWLVPCPSTPGKAKWEQDRCLECTSKEGMTPYCKLDVYRVLLKPPRRNLYRKAAGW